MLQQYNETAFCFAFKFSSSKNAHSYNYIFKLAKDKIDLFDNILDIFESKYSFIKPKNVLFKLLTRQVNWAFVIVFIYESGGV